MQCFCLKVLAQTLDYFVCFLLERFLSDPRPLYCTEERVEYRAQAMTSTYFACVQFTALSLPHERIQ